MRSRHRRVVVLLAFVLAAAALLTGTGGYSSMGAERGIQVSVADDPHAFLGIEVVNTDGEVGDQFVLLRLSDQFGPDTDVGVDDVEIVSPGAPVELASEPNDLPAAVTVECVEGTDGEAVEIELRIEVAGDGVSVEKTKTVGLICTAATTTTTTAATQDT